MSSTTSAAGVEIASPAGPRPTAYWVLANGQVRDANSSVRGHWKWLQTSKADPSRPGSGSKSGAKNDIRTPVWRYVYEWEVRFPAGYRILKVEPGDGIELATPPPSKSRTVGRSARLRTTNRESKVTFTVENRSKRRMTYPLLMRFSPKDSVPEPIVHESCTRLGISGLRNPRRAPTTGSPLFVGLACDDLGTDVGIYLLFPADSDLTVMKGRGPTAASPGWMLIRYPMPAKNVIFKKRMLLALSTTSSKGPTHFVIFTPVNAPARRWAFSVGTAVTLLNYNETAKKNYGLQAGMLTAKGGASYQIIPDTLDAGISVYGNLIPIKFDSTPSDLSNPRFFGINGRLGYRLPVDFGALTWSFLGGWYLWGMSSGETPYGVEMLGGPQVFVSVRYQRRGYRLIAGYAKFAPIAPEPGSLNFETREIAFGGAYQINAPNSNRAWMATLDFSTFRLALPEYVNRIRLETLSLGISTSF